MVDMPHRVRGEGCTEGGLAREDDWKADTCTAVAARARATTAGKPRGNSISLVSILVFN